MSEPFHEGLPADYFDGLSARARKVNLRVIDGLLQVTGDGIQLAVPVGQVRWPERTRHGARTAHFQQGGSVQALDAGEWDAWARRAGLHESAVVKAQQSWRGAAMAAVLLFAVVAAGYQWGVPWAARAALVAIPASVDRTVGEAVLKSFDDNLLLPSAVPPARQDALRSALAQAVKRVQQQSHGQPLSYDLRFHDSPRVPSRRGNATRLGPNAFALPGGVVIVTDEMLRLLEGRDDVLIGVLGHELGHVQRRHGMRMLLQTTVIGAAASLVWGDISSVLAAAPVILGQSAYSREFEREADDDAIALLRANGMSPTVMIELFERLKKQRANDEADQDGKAGAGLDLGIALASHPADAQRMQHFREAAAR
jgi:Zn-dependent protease with chaperone function